MEIFGFEVNHEYMMQYVEAFEHNIWTFEVHFDTFSVFQTVWGILYLFKSPKKRVESFLKIARGVRLKKLVPAGIEPATFCV